MEAQMPPIPGQPPEVDNPEKTELDPDTEEVDESAGADTEVIEDDIDESGEGDTLDALSQIRQSREEAQPFGKTKILEVPGYHGLLAIQYQYIGSEITEAIARKVRKETRAVNGQGTNLLASIDTLRAGCKRVLIRRKTGDKWMSIGGAERPYVRLDTSLCPLLNFHADNGREVVLGIFGSEHKIVQQNVIYSQWLTDQTRTADEDFLS